MKGVAELSLNAQEVSEVDQALMMIEVFVQEVYQILYVICCLDPLEFFLEAHILWGFLVRKDLLTCLLVYSHLVHAQYFLDLGPRGVGLDQKILSAASANTCFIL